MLRFRHQRLRARNSGQLAHPRFQGKLTSDPVTIIIFWLEELMYGYGLVGLIVTVILVVLLLRLLGVM